MCIQHPQSGTKTKANVRIFCRSFSCHSLKPLTLLLVSCSVPESVHNSSKLSINIRKCDNMVTPETAPWTANSSLWFMQWNITKSFRSILVEINCKAPFTHPWRLLAPSVQKHSRRAWRTAFVRPIRSNSFNNVLAISLSRIVPSFSSHNVRNALLPFPANYTSK